MRAERACLCFVDNLPFSWHNYGYLLVESWPGSGSTPTALCRSSSFSLSIPRAAMTYQSDPNPEFARFLLDLLDHSLQSIWDGDAEAYAALTAEDVSFFEWYISSQRIDGLDFHLREIRIHRAAVGGADDVADLRIEHEILQPRIQVYGDTAIISYTLFVRVVQGGHVRHLSHNESRVFHNFGDDNAPDWKLVHCHKSPIATAESMSVLRG